MLYRPCNPTLASCPITNNKPQPREVHACERAVITYFEDDDTGSDSDAILLQGILGNSFDIAATLIVLPKGNPSAPFLLRHAIDNAIYQMSPSQSQFSSLFVIGYIGHAAIDQTANRVQFTSAGNKEYVRWSFLENAYFSVDSSLSNIDTPGVFDCGFVVATRKVHNRMSQVLCASRPRETARCRTVGYISSMQRLCFAVQELRGATGSVVSYGYYGTRLVGTVQY